MYVSSSEIRIMLSIILVDEVLGIDLCLARSIINLHVLNFLTCVWPFLNSFLIL